MKKQRGKLTRTLALPFRYAAAGWLALHMVAAPCLASEEVLPPRLAELFTRGVQAQKAGRLGEAEKALQEVLREGGKVSFVYNNLGALYQQRHEHEKAIVQFREAIRLKPDYAAPHLLMGASLLALGRVPEATKQLEQAVKLQPREPLARLELGHAYERGGNLPAAVEQYRSLQDLAPHEPEYIYKLGLVYQKLGSWCFEQIRRLDPDSPRVYQALGEKYLASGQPEFAVRAYQRAAQADPKLPGIHLALAQIYMQQQKAAEARMQIEQELAIVPESVAAQALRARIDSMGSNPR